jgi:hypothetical protein
VRVSSVIRAAAAGSIAVLAVAGCGGASKVASVPGHEESVFHLKVGQCVVPPTDIKVEVTAVKVVSCRSPHTQEVFAVLRDRGGDVFPGPGQVTTFANGECLQQFKPYVGDDYRDSSLFYTYLLPSVRSWAAGDRTVVCLITTTGQQLTASVKGSDR